MNLYIHTTAVSFNENLKRSTKIMSPECRISEIVSPVSTYKNLTPDTTKIMSPECRISEIVSPISTYKNLTLDTTKYKCFTFNNINNKKIFKIYNNFFFKKKFKISNYVFSKKNKIKILK
jgi:hypothetical protein